MEEWRLERKRVHLLDLRGLGQQVVQVSGEELDDSLRGRRRGERAEMAPALQAGKAQLAEAWDVGQDRRPLVRKHYDGPLELDCDLMVFSVTRDQILRHIAIVSNATRPNKEFQDDDFKKLHRGERRVMSS